MPFIPHTGEEEKKILKFLGVKDFEEVLESIPEEIRLKEEIPLPSSLKEEEVEKRVKELAEKNRVLKVFGGAGSYDHYVPPVVRFVLRNPSFVTAYTPYQAEVSQGTLQAMYEFQTVICELTRMDISNSSMYDGASSLAEAILMAKRIKKRKKILIAENIHPFYKKVCETYTLEYLEIEYVPYDKEKGTVDLNSLKELLKEDVSAFAFQHPNFFGCLEDPFKLREITKEKDALLISVFDPISLSVLAPPGEYGADIAVAEGQSLGLPLSFGGPYLGIFTAKKEFIRQMPGRISGKTVDRDGNEGYAMVLQTREQHIRRERATSNICTNQMLCAIGALCYVLYKGAKGLYEVAQETHLNTLKIYDYLREKGYKFPFSSPFFREFIVELEEPAMEFIKKSIDKKGILPGIPLSIFGMNERYLLIGSTEKYKEEDIEELISLFE